MLPKNKQAITPVSSNPKKTVGLLGGTFDPPHIGHLVVADQVRSALDLDEIRLVVANQPWQKTDSRKITSAVRRLEMVGSAVSESLPLSKITVSDVEIVMGGPSFTFETLNYLTNQEPETEWKVIIGADTATQLNTWHRANELRLLTSFVVVNRPGWVGQPSKGWDWQLVEIPSLEVSSSELRAAVACGKSIQFLTPNVVIQHIHSWGLYRQEL